MAQYTVSSGEGKLILLGTILASGMAFLDGTVVNIAIPVIQTALHADFGSIQWMVNLYMLMLSSLILISGALGDRFGRKRIFIYGMGLFVISSALCGLAQTIEQLILFRGVQGIGAAMMIPGSLSIIDVSFAESQRGRAIGMWSGYAGGIAALGPFLGGWLVQTFGWPSIFFINIPIGIVAFFITSRFVPESKNEEVRKLDIWGTVSLFVGLLGLVYGLINGSTAGYTNPAVLIPMLIGTIMLCAFVVIEKRVAAPLTPFEIFRSPLVLGANLVTFALYFALSGVVFFLVLNFQQVQHFGPLLAGIGMLPTILLITFLSGWGGTLADKIGPRIPMIVGPLLVALGMGILALIGKNTNYFIQVLPGLVLFGLGMAITIAPLTKSALSVPKSYSGAASGVNNSVSRIAGLLAVALLGAIALAIFGSHLTRAMQSMGLDASQHADIMAQKDKYGAIEIPATFPHQVAVGVRSQIEDAFISSYRVVIGIAAYLALLSSFVAFVTIRNPKKE